MAGIKRFNPFLNFCTGESIEHPRDWPKVVLKPIR